MTERQLRNKIKSLGRELDLMMLYKQEFLDKLGSEGLEEEINKRLEQYQYYLNKLKELTDE